MTAIEISLPLVVAQWALLFGLGALVLVLFRQLAYLLEIGRAVSGQGSLTIGERAPEFEFWPALADDYDGKLRVFAPTGAPTLLMFTHPGCGSCEIVLRNLEKALQKFRDKVRVLAVTDADPTMIEAVEAFRDTPIEVVRVDRKVPTKLYRTYRTPFFYGINAEGEIRTKGGGATVREIRSLVRGVLNENEPAKVGGDRHRAASGSR